MCVCVSVGGGGAVDMAAQPSRTVGCLASRGMDLDYRRRRRRRFHRTIYTVGFV